MLAFARKLLGSSNERRVKDMRGRVAAINALEPKISALSDAQLKAKTDEFKARLAKGETLDDLLDEAFAVVREAAKRVLGQRHYDVQLVGGMVLHQGGIAEMRTGEGKTLVATLRRLSERARGQGRPRHHRQRLPGAARLGVDGPGLRVPGHDHGDHRQRPQPGRAPAQLQQRHHLRHQQRVRLRLPARQPRLRRRRDGPARAQLRHRRRGGLHPDRRGAHAADHLRPDRGPQRLLPHHRHPGEAADPGQGDLRARREAEAGHPHRARQRGGRGDADGRRPPGGGHRRPLRRRQHHRRPPRQPGAARQHPLHARQGLHRQRRRGDADRRVHRPHDDRAAACPRACTRPSRPRKASRSSPRTRPWPR